MEIFGKLACLTNWHKPNRRRVRWNGRNFSGHCLRCERAIVREAHRKWREEADYPDAIPQAQPR